MQGNLKSQLNSFSNRLRLNSEKIEQIKIIESLLADILDPNQDPSEIVLKIRSQSLTRGELRSFGHNTDLPENIVNTYMRMLKSSHKRQRTGTSDRVLISKSGLSDDIFSKSREIVHSKPNILNYTYLLFPLFVGSWTLLVFNTKESHVYYYDPIKEHEKIHSLLDRLYNFIQQFLVQNHKVFDETERKGLIYVPVKNHVLYAAKDSGAYVCMQAELLISGKSTIPDIEDYKKDMLVSLIRASLE